MVVTDGVLREWVIASESQASQDLAGNLCEGLVGEAVKNIVFNVPGCGAMAGTYRGKEGVYELARKAMKNSGGSFAGK